MALSGRVATWVICAAPTKKPPRWVASMSNFGRGDRIRTCDFYVPNVALYQAELHPAGSRLFYPSGIVPSRGLLKFVCSRSSRLLSSFGQACWRAGMTPPVSAALTRRTGMARVPEQTFELGSNVGNKKATAMGGFLVEFWSGRQDSNLRLLRPERSALPG